MIAYMIRVMLSHVRIKAAAARKNGMPGHPPELQELYAKMNEFKLEGPPRKMPKGPSSSQPSSSRPNPFVRFQAAEESESESEEEEEPAVGDDDAIVVIKQLHVGESCCMGVMRMSDGSKVPASNYSPGPEGFIICNWDDGETLETEIPNMFLAPLGEFIIKPSVANEPPPVKPKAQAKGKGPMKKPAAADEGPMKKPAAADGEALAAPVAEDCRFILVICGDGRCLIQS